MHTKKDVLKVVLIYNTESTRDIFINAIDKINNIGITGIASDVFNGAELINQTGPDVVLLSTEMPGLSSIEFIRYNLKKFRKPVLLISSQSHKCKHLTFQALETGAVGFVIRPAALLHGELSNLIDELKVKLFKATGANLNYWLNKASDEILDTKKKSLTEVRTDSQYKVIVMYSSIGDAVTIRHIITRLPAGMPCILLVTQMPAGYTKIFADRLNQVSLLNVKEAVSGDIIAPGNVFVAAGNFHLKILPERGRFLVDCQPGEKVYGNRPSANVLMFSVTEHIGGNAIGVLLSGIGRDGAEGLRIMKESGSVTLVQDKGSAILYETIKYALEIEASKHQIELDKIPEVLVKIVNGEFKP